MRSRIERLVCAAPTKPDHQRISIAEVVRRQRRSPHVPL
jgi:hypothetical protein